MSKTVFKSTMEMLLKKRTKMKYKSQSRSKRKRRSPLSGDRLSDLWG